MRGGTPESLSKGGRVAAERRRALKVRDDALEEAILGHREKLLAIIGEILEKMGGKQHRCGNCGAFGPKVSSMTINEAIDAAMKLDRRREGSAVVGVGVTVNVVAGVQVVPNLPAERPE